MSIAKAVKVIAVSVGVCGVAGLLIGLLLGLVAPGYYEAMFVNGTDPRFDPVGVGIGLGVTQGLGVGVLVGCVITLAVAWTERRRQVDDVTHD